MNKTLSIILLFLCLAGCSSGSSNNYNTDDADGPLFNESEESVERFGFPEDDDRYGTSYMFYKKFSESKIGYSGGWTLTYCTENDVVMCSVFYKDSAPVIGIGDGIYSIRQSSGCFDGRCHYHDYGSTLKSIRFSKNLKYINRMAFDNCTGLTEVYIPSTVVFIGNYAFMGCSNLVIKCQATSQPSSWQPDWNYSNCPVIWGC